MKTFNLKNFNEKLRRYADFFRLKIKENSRTITEEELSRLLDAEFAFFIEDVEPINREFDPKVS